MMGVCYRASRNLLVPSKSARRQWHQWLQLLPFTFALLCSNLEAATEMGPYSSDFLVFDSIETPSNASRQYWDSQLQKNPDILNAIELERREFADLPESIHLCPPKSVSSKRTRCICRLGYSCTGSKWYCQQGLSNRAVRHRIEGWLIQRCPQCRCDPIPCKQHRVHCGTDCQLFTEQITKQPSTEMIPHVTQGLPSIVCIIQVGQNQSRLEGLLNTWSRYCEFQVLIIPPSAKLRVNRTMHDGSSLTNIKIVRLPGGSRQYDLTVAPLAKVLSTALSHKRNFSWFLMVNDKTYIMMLNLKTYLATLQHENTNNKPFFLGRKLVDTSNGFLFNSEDSGWLLNKEALSILVRKLKEGMQTTKPSSFVPLKCTLHANNSRRDVEQSVCMSWTLSNDIHTLPDSLRCNPNMPIEKLSRVVSACLADAGVLPYDTRDTNKLERFHLFDPENTINFQSLVMNTRNWHLQTILGPISVSPSSISIANLTTKESFEAVDVFLKQECYQTMLPATFTDAWSIAKENRQKELELKEYLLSQSATTSLADHTEDEAS
eukprot:m.2507 g.2507  ORF g.2507 m.2507 type:complete len:547 (-) comp2533_c0_seq1:115-1755(-)